ncbi:short-chain dehydrogenase [Brevibacillus brevis]|uniref:Short-chain dehydrogenase n=1 Tax=Brevibacillus brevis TaxID=1393 RepID=A0ABY9TBB9_BREBE|nr:short-chain dehydrogenase [Brevibacillus brevis]WNC16754.1 short-chain dehydrogenase [Brevibacillus brevis]
MGKEALVVGGSGMLAEVSRWLARTGYHVTVIGREQSRLDRVAEESDTPGSFTMLALDYRDTEALKQAVSDLVRHRGPVDVVVAWIHGTAPDALAAIQRELMGQKKEWLLFHVCGSRAWIQPPAVEEIAYCRYRRVILGFVTDAQSSRWLTHSEISRGVIRAMQTDEPLSIVGTVEPWERRPTE